MGRIENRVHAYGTCATYKHMSNLLPRYSCPRNGLQAWATLMYGAPDPHADLSQHFALQELLNATESP